MTWQGSLPSTIAALALASAATGAGCGGDSRRSPPVGSLALTTKLADGVRASEAAYDVTGNGLHLTGRFEIFDPAATILVVIGDIPEGFGYEVAVDATASTAESCHGSHRADIYAGETTLVGVELQCQEATSSGGVGVDVTVTGCVRLESYSASPLTASAGDSILVSAAATNVLGSTRVAFSWSASAGAFENPNAASTTYFCMAGKQTLSVTVSDGSCSDSASIPVTCL
jgi:hypothetical protein